MQIYINKNKSITGHFRFVVPIKYFNLQKDSDVTILHLTEHCCFGNFKNLPSLNQSAYRFGGYIPEGKITKTTIEFFWSFYNSNLQDAFLWFQSFIKNFQAITTDKDLDFFKKEVSKELSELDDVYVDLSKIRHQFFQNTPFCLSSGGKKKLIKDVTIDQINQFKKIIYHNGTLFLSTDIDRAEFKNLNIDFKDTIMLPQQTPLKPEIKNNVYLNNQSLAISLPQTSNQIASILNSSIYYLINECQLFEKLASFVNCYPSLTSLIFIGDDCQVDVKKIFKQNHVIIQKAIKFGQLVAKERKEQMPDEVLKNLSRDWANNIQKSISVKQALKYIQKMILT